MIWVLPWGSISLTWVPSALYSKRRVLPRASVSWACEPPGWQPVSEDLTAFYASVGSVNCGSRSRMMETLKTVPPSKQLKDAAMSAVEPKLLEKLNRLSPEKLAEVENFVDFLANKSRRQAAFDRLLAVAPALEAAGVEPMSEDRAAALVKEVRAERRARRKDEPPGASRP